MTALTFRRILVDVDATAAAQPALEEAARIARRCGAALTIVDVVPSAPDLRSGRRSHDSVEEFVRRRAALRRLADGVAGVRVSATMLGGPPSTALIEEVVRGGHDLLVRSRARDMVARGHGAYAAVDVQLFRKCPCPVLALGPGVAPARPRIVAAVHAAPGVADSDDAHDLDRRVVAAAVSMAAHEQGSVTLLHAWRPVGELSVMSHATDEEFTAFLEADRRAAASRLERMKQQSGVPSAARVELRHGTPEVVIPEFIVAEGADTLVIGSVGRTGVSGLLRGNTVERILAALPCSVLVVKPRRFALPVMVDVDVPA